MSQDVLCKPDPESVQAESGAWNYRSSGRAASSPRCAALASVAEFPARRGLPTRMRSFLRGIIGSSVD